MYLPLTKAAFGDLVVMEKIIDSDLAGRLRQMGLFEGSEIVRLNQEVLVQPVRVRGPGGEVVLGGGMAMKIVVHLDDGRKLPLVEMRSGETGHLEGLTGSPDLSAALETLGLGPNCRLVFIRKLPPMEYVTLVSEGGRVRLTEGMAAKIWGLMQGRAIQFVSARSGEKFLTRKIIGGPGSRRMLLARGIEPGKTLVLEKVAQAQSVHSNLQNPVVISSREGLRLFLTPEDGKKILVRKPGPDH
ncbi:MAG: FeoA domain-containing protein [Pseudomonadota bacterium]